MTSKLESKLESTKELILLMQNKLAASKKSKSVENLNHMSQSHINTNQRRALIN